MKSLSKPCRLLLSLFLLSVVEVLTGQISFTNVAGVGADASDISANVDGGLAFADFDLDGDLDLLVNSTDNSATTRSYLLRNDDGVYSDVTSSVAPGLKTSETERTAAWGDCNNDGYPDILVNGNVRIKVLLSNGGVNFSTILDVTAATDGLNCEGAGWLDYDTDGDLDFFIENHNYGVDVFQNNGAASPTFTQVTINAIGAVNSGAGGLGLPEGGSTTGDYGTSTDLNADGYPDILVRRQNSGVNNGVDRNPYDVFINDGDGTFTPNTSLNEEASNGNKGGVVSGDFDNDGDFDILWTSASSSGNRAVVYENTGNNSMVFSMLPNPFALDGGGAENSADFDGCALGDIDHDGDLDVFMTQNSGASKLFLNLSSGPGNFSFRQPGPSWIPGAALNYGINVSANGEGCVFVDYDNDGDVDLYINKTGNNQLWQNDYVGSATESAATYQDNYLRVIPIVDLGGGMERPALNATVQFQDCDGNTIGGIREVGSGGAGHGAQTSPWLIYGLPNGPDASYRIQVQFTRNGTSPVSVVKTVIPSLLPNIASGTSTLIVEQTLIVVDTDTDDQHSCDDNDGDGIYNPIDLDDDNDGIPDIDECPTANTMETLLNSSFETPGVPGSWAPIHQSLIPGWETDEASGTIEIWSAAFAGGGIPDGGFVCELQYVDFDNVYQVLDTEPGSTFTWSGYHKGRLGTDVAELRIGASLATAVTQVTMSDGSVAWGYYTGQYTVPAGQTSTYFVLTPMTSSSGPGAGNLVDDWVTTLTVPAPAACDTDMDGVFDYLDLDSDNDGIFDLVESGHGETDANEDGVIDGGSSDFGDNGLFDSIESSIDSGTINYTIADSDLDGNIDSTELDSDDDGCNDVIEAGFEDHDGNGLLGTGN